MNSENYPNPEIQNKKVDIGPLFERAGVDGDQISITETPGMYPFKERIEDNWAYYTAVGFRKLKEILKQENNQVRNIGIVGIGSGVEGIAAAKVFGSSLETMAISDIDSEIILGAEQNIQAILNTVKTKVLALEGSLAEPLAKQGIKFDIIHGNIPNLPSVGDHDLTRGAEKGTFVPTETYDIYSPPKKYLQWAMGAQYAYLESAKEALSNNGSVITELGGRMPLHLVRELFEEQDYNMQEILVGFKEQTEALIDFEGYHRLEEEFGVQFDFYRYDDAIAILEKNGMQHNILNQDGETTKKLLQSCRVTAGEAIDLYHEGIPVGHTVHLFRGTLQ